MVCANKVHKLADINFLTIAAVLCGAKGWKAIKIFGEAQLGWLRENRKLNLLNIKAVNVSTETLMLPECGLTVFCPCLSNLLRKSIVRHEVASVGSSLH